MSRNPPLRKPARLEVHVEQEDVDLLRRYYTEHGSMAKLIRALLKRHLKRLADKTDQILQGDH